MFQTARLKLTAWYLLIIMLVSVSFSAVIYRALTLEVERFGRIQRYRIENQLRNDVFILFDERHAPPMLPVEDPNLVQYVKRRILTFLVLTNGSVFILSGLLGYVLAGRTLKPIKDMVDEQNRFISDASHELRTPLTALKSTMEVHLRDKNLTLHDAKTVIRDSIEEVDTLQSLSDSLLTLAQYQKPNGTQTMERLDIHTLLETAVKKVTPLAKKKDIRITYKEIHAQIQGDRYSLIDLFVILLDNAIKYSPRSAAIEIGVEKNDKRVAVSVKDEGVGISKKDLPYIFDRFYRADSARTKNIGDKPVQTDGYGLGLAIAKKIVTMHHGTIIAKSKPSQGSTFTVILS